MMSKDENVRRTNRRRKTKVLCFTLICIISAVLAMITSADVFAEDNSSDVITYRPERQKYAIAPASLYMNEDFYNQYVKTDAVWAFNSITYYTANALNYSTEKVGYKEYFTRFIPDFDPILESLRKKGDLLVNFRVSLANNGYYRQFAEMYPEYKYGSYSWSSEYRDYGDMNYTKCGKSLNLKYDGYTGARMKNSALVFADITPPKMKEVYASSTMDGPAETIFNKNSSVAYFHVKFDENIRFSDNNRNQDNTTASHNNIFLNLKVTNAGGATINDAYQRARLVRLKGDTLTFIYDIPETIKGSPLNHCITGIYGIVDDNYGAEGKKGVDVLNSSYLLRVLTYTGELYGHYTSSGLKTYSSRSLITDAAGNPADAALAGVRNIIYIDKVSPYITKVSIDAPENKSGYVGPECGITPSVTFSEPVYSHISPTGYEPLNLLDKFIAVLNIKDQMGDYLKVKGSFSYKDNTLKFKTLKLPSGITIDDGDSQIRVTSVSISESDYNSLKPTDARGNALDRVITSLPPSSDQFIADTDGPVIATDFNMTAGGKYMPVVYDSNSDAEKDSFYFSFRLSDPGSGVQPSGSEANINGSFSWDLDDPGVPSADLEKLTFKYILTNNADHPGEERKWNEGKFGRDYMYTQLGQAAGAADNMYLHIKVGGLEGVDLDESVLTVTASDLVGNSSEKAFVLDGNELNKMLDQTPPEITINRLYTYKDTDGEGKWKFAADFTLKDISGVDTDKVYSQWTESGAAPHEEGWTKLSGLGADAKILNGTDRYTLKDDNLNSRDLYIKAADCSNNANVIQTGPYKFEMNLRKPVFESYYSADRTTMAALVIEAEAQCASIGEGEGIQQIPAVILVTVGNHYKSLELSSDVSADIFSSDGWNKIDNESTSDDIMFDSILNGTYYGKIDVRVDIGYGISYSGGEMQTEDYSLSETYDFKLYTAPSTDRIHGITINSSLADAAGGWSSPEDGAKYPTDLAGASFNVAISNIRVPEWGVEDADFENSFFAIYRTADDVPVFSAPIRSAAPSITIPNGLDLPGGIYYARAAVTARTSGRVDVSEKHIIILDTTQPEDFGLSATETLWLPSGDPADPDVAALFGKIGTDIAYRGYDRVHNSGEAGYESVPTVLLGSGDNGYAAPLRKLYFTTKSTNNEFYIKVWNATEGIDEKQSKEQARWLHIEDTADSGSGAGYTALAVGSADEIVTSYSTGIIPVINNTENIIKYQLCHANGMKSVEKVLLAKVSDNTPVLEAALTPENLPASQVTARITRLYSPYDAKMQVFFWADGSMSDPADVGAVADPEGNITLQQVDNNWLYTSDIYGNYAIVNVSAPNLDADEPVIESAGFSQNGDMYQFSVTVRDKNFSELFMKFDDTYTERLGLMGYFRLEIPEPDISGTGGTWTADSPRSDGIYRIVRTDSSDGSVNLDITGVYMYDEGGGSPPATVDVGYTLMARDAAGNESILDVPASPVKNARPELSLGETVVRETVSYNTALTPSNLNSDGTMDLYSMRASFNLPVRNVTPIQHRRAENSYGLSKDFLNIFKDGTYTVSYEDIFGIRHSEEKTVSVSNDMNIVMTGLNDQGKYSLSAEPVENEGKNFIPNNEGKAFTLFADIYDATLFGEHTRAINVRRIVTEFGGDETAIIAMMVYEPHRGGWFLDGSTPIILIDGSTRQAPSAEVHWYYHEFASDTLPAGETETDCDVDVWITSDTPVNGINGKLLSHTFTYDDAGSYTFEYANSDGITGSTTVTLPISIVRNKEHQGGGEQFRDDDLGINEEDLYKKPPDTTPPGVILSVSGRFGNLMDNKGSWYSGSSDELKSLFTWSSAFVLYQSDIIDDSETKTILLRGISPDISGISYENARSGSVQGVELAGREIRVTAQVTDPTTPSVIYPEDFTVLIIDEAGNKTVIAFPAGCWDQLDVIAPQIHELNYKKTDFTKIEASFKLMDDKTPAGQVKLLSPGGLAYDAVAGIYTMTFVENREVEAALRDLAGNVGKGTIKVADLDDRPPSVASVWYSKGYVNNKGEYDPTQLTIAKTNQPIIARLVSDKQVSNVELTDVKGNDFGNLPPGADPSDYVTMSWDTGSVTLEFRQNAYASLTFTALNGKMNVYGIAVFDVIDRNVPVIAVDKQDNTTDTYAVVTFTNPAGTGEPVHVYGPGESGKQLFEPGDVMTKTFTARGTYIFRFTDEAGNTRTEKIEIENIDEHSPGILTADLPPAGTYYNDSVTFKATMSEAGTLTFNGVSATVAAPVDRNGNGTIDADVNGNGKADPEDNECEWHTFTVTQNGNFPITAVDEAGRKTTAYVAVKCFDKAGPVISFDPAVINVMSGTDPAGLLALLGQGVTVTDNSTAPAEIDLTHDDVSTVNLAVPGQYRVTYTATDKAGNKTTAGRYVKVFSASEVSVLVNGIRTEAGSTTVLNDLQVILEVSKLPMGDNEPYKVYLRKGVWTAGQMKGTEPLTQTGAFTLPDKDCFYTLYIVTQNRGTYLTYLYTQK